MSRKSVSTWKYEQVPGDLPKYHPNSELNTRAGYYPNINNHQLAAVNALLELIDKENLRFNYDEEHEFLRALRFLRARKFNVQLAFKLIQEDIRWRGANNRFNLRNERAEDILDCDLEAFYKYYSTWVQGKDRQGRSVSYRKFGHFEIWNVLKLTTQEKLQRFHSWQTERVLDQQREESQRTGYNVETFVLIIDAEGWNPSLATSDAFRFLKAIADIDSCHYPERLGTLMVINAPSFLAFAWKIVQTFLDDVTKTKVKIMGSNREQWLPAMLEHIDQDQIPQQYGGYAPDFTPAEAMQHMNPPSLTDDDGDDRKSGKVIPPARVTFEQGIQTDDPFERAMEEKMISDGCTIS